MGQEKKKEGKAVGKKSSRRGKRGAGSRFVQHHKKKLAQGTRTGELRERTRQERSTAPSVPVERRLVPSLPHDPKDGGLGAHPGVVEYYRSIAPRNHPYLRLVEDAQKKCHVIVTRDIRMREDVRLCCVVGYLTKTEPAPGCGIKLGHGEYIDYSNVLYDLGYHALKFQRHVENLPAEPNYSRYIKCRDDARYHVNCMLVGDSVSQRVVWFKLICDVSMGDKLVVKFDPRFMPTV